jgi:hypothetical protein
VRLRRSDLGFAVFGSALGAALVIPAASADAGTTYNSTATATAGYVSIAGNQIPVPDNSVTATDSASPRSASLGLSQAESALSGVPALGPALVAGLRDATPDGASLVTETATANSAGKSTACAGLLAGNCSASGTPAPITIRLSLGDLFTLASGNSSTSGSSSGSSSSGSPASILPSGLPGSLLPSGLPTGLPTSLLPSLGGSAAGQSPLPLAGFAVVLAISGPDAACTAGPAGSAGSNFTATENLAAVTVDVQDNGKSVLPGGPRYLSSGELQSQLTRLSQLPARLLSELGAASPANPVNVTIDPGSTSGVGSGPQTSATAGRLSLSVGGTQVLDVSGATAVCGLNHAVATTARAPAATSSEIPLGGGIQTDEGRYTPPAPSDTALWLGLAVGGVALAGSAGGTVLWRRRLHR